MVLVLHVPHFRYHLQLSLVILTPPRYHLKHIPSAYRSRREFVERYLLHVGPSRIHSSTACVLGAEPFSCASVLSEILLLDLHGIKWLKVNEEICNKACVLKLN